MKIEITPLFVKHDFRILDPSSYLSLIIRIVIWFKYNHVAIKLTEDGIDYVVESRSSGVFKSTFDNWIKHRPNKRWEEGKNLVIEIRDINIRLGNKYNIPSLFDQLVYQSFGIWLGSKKDNKENCAQLLSDIIHRDKAYLDTPKSLYYAFGIVRK